ncbi:MAG: HDOD domain-containing protein, partial [Pirellulales bacterium]|nr:HDOD domain-containing protein [Pirellulales bacterium]
MVSAQSAALRLGRQPIFDRENQLLAYELLYRDSSSPDSANFVDGEIATASVLCNALLEIGLGRVTGDKPVFVNFTKSFLTGETPIPLGRERIVVEVLESVEIDESVVAGLRHLSEQGYIIALDDFVYSPKWDACLEIADIVKLDVLAMSEVELRAHVTLLNKYDVALVAEKVEDYQTRQRCMELGFDFFQGYYFAKPDVLEEAKVQASQLAILSTLIAINNPEAEVDDIADAVSQDAILTHKLIRYVNSSAFGLRDKIECPRQVIVYLGKEEVRSIVTMLLITSIANKPPELMKTALIRAKACQNIAVSENKENHESYFTVGLLSMLDALMDRPMSEIMQELPLTVELKNSILNYEG